MNRPIASRRYAIGLWLLFLLFAFGWLRSRWRWSFTRLSPAVRVVAQRPVPYGVLLASQVAILLALGWTAWRFTIGDVTPRRASWRSGTGLGRPVFRHRWLLRLVLGLTVLSHLRWFASPVPTVFHLVLAAFAAALWAISLRQWRRNTPRTDKPIWRG